MNNRNQPGQYRPNYPSHQHSRGNFREESDRNYRGGQDIERGYGRDFGRNYRQDFVQNEDWSPQRDFRQTSDWDSDQDIGRNYEWSSGPYGERNFDQNYDQGWSRNQSTERIGQRQGLYTHGPHSGKGPKGFQRSAESLKEQVCEKLESNGYVDASEIEVEVKNCEVTLSGKVASREDKREAERCAESVSGVKDVHNRLTVDSNLSGSQSGQRMESDRSAQLRGIKSKDNDSM